MFVISEKPLEALEVRNAMATGEAGAYAAFEGWVRNRNEGRAVLSLEYEAFGQLARREGDRIMAEARSTFDILDARCTHRVGHLQIGELAVWVGVTSRHRDAAFAACRYVIDEIKSRVPIWKKEHYADGEAQWVNCATCAAHGHRRGSGHGH